MNPIEKLLWSRLQVEVWVCTRSLGAVQLAASTARSLGLADQSHDVDDQDYDDEGLPIFCDEDEFFSTAIVRYGCSCSRYDARKEIEFAVSEGLLRAQTDNVVSSRHEQLFEPALVQGIWPGKAVGEPQEHASDCRSEDAAVIDVFDALHWIAFGYAAAPSDGRATSSWDDAERWLVRALQLGSIVASGFERSCGERREIPASFWIDAQLEPVTSCAFREDQWSRENEWEQVRLYRRDVVQQWPSPFSTRPNEPVIGGPASQPAEASVTGDAPAAVDPARSPLAQGEGQTDGAYPSENIRRKGGRPAKWVKSLKYYLELRVRHGHDLETMSLTEIRTDFLSYATRNREIRNIPKARSSLDEQIKKIRAQVLPQQ